MIVRPAMRALVRQVWDGTEHLPETGAILAVNHISEVDPLSVAHMVYNQGLLPTFLAKAELWKVPVLKQVLEATRMIPVERTRDGGRSLAAAREAVATGRAIIVYPEGTVTRDPDGWPMAGRNGAVRLALQTGAPLIPVGQWGIQELLPYGGRSLRVLPRKTARIRVGAPVDLADLRDRPVTAGTLREGTGRMMAAITDLVAELRGEPAPEGRWDPTAGARVTGA
ncbi:lysophospholipid acyltransferase family protein [Micrococcus luteus]|uniref:lysophospholipid acyltransferase family protein n=1 Tax=Micrococcus luteus TaxID=1270 RepID=UPI001D0CC562|nr:lysophospholipid acyltransferase family protein [Micrococcus luteus]MCC0765752.1 1-acyl-sn-glycerol-3-phosphate acyltransferase [Micrococcus luteus]